MDNNSSMLQLCRLCLVKDDVNIPIFEEQGDIRQIFLKISSCLPVKLSRDDRLPKKICDGCSYKLDMLYEFWNTSANAEKQLLTWLGEAGMTSKMTDGTISAVAQQIKPADAFVKQETIDPPDIRHEDDDDDKNFVYNEKHEENARNNADEPPPKRARRTAAVKAAIAMDQDSDDDDDSGEPMTKMEDDSEDSDNDDQEPSFADVPSTSADDQPGPSGVNKDGVEAPSQKNGKPAKKRRNPEPKIDESLTKLSAILKIDKPLTCPSCKKPFNSHLDLAYHSKKHNEFKLHTCHLCNFAVATKFRIRRHINGHAGWKCEVCSKIFRKSGAALKHYYLHTGEKMYQCAFCGKHLANSKSLDTHVNTIHHEIVTGKPLVKFDCPICKKHYESETGLRRHYSSSHKEMGVDLTVICEVCGLRISNRTRLTRHMRTHNGEKPFPCSLCSKRFATKCLLTSHLRVHTGEKPYCCSFCGKRFGQSAPYRYHIKIHTGDRRYQCKLCGKAFISNSNLKIHTRTCCAPIRD